MAMKKWTGNMDTEIFEKEKGNTLKGVYTGKRVNVGPNESTLYNVEQKGGEVMSIWSDSIVTNFFDNIPVGSMVEIKYLGKEKSDKTGRTYHNYDISYDDSTADKQAKIDKELEDVVA